MKKGLTLIEAFIAVLIALALACFIWAFYISASARNYEDVDYSLINPQIETARSQRRIAEEMQRQNDLLQRRLELLEQKNVEKEH
jgi:Tfp pilus assembly protein PilE